MVALSGWAMYQWHPDRPAFYLVPNQLRDDEVLLEKVLEWEADQGVVWIDARSRANYDQSHVEGAYLLNEIEDFYSLLEPIWAKIQIQQIYHSLYIAHLKHALPVAKWQKS